MALDIFPLKHTRIYRQTQYLHQKKGTKRRVSQAGGRVPLVTVMARAAGKRERANHTSESL